jgi:hypothetical protein
MQKGFPDQSSTAVASTLRLPAKTFMMRNYFHASKFYKVNASPEIKVLFFLLYVEMYHNSTIFWLGHFTLAARGLEELFFQLCCCVSFLVPGGKKVWVLLIYVSRVQDSCGIVLVFWFWWEIVFGVTYILSVQYTCAVVSVFWLWRELVLWRERVLKMRTPFDFLWAVSTRKSYWVTLLWSNSRCVYFVRPNTLLLFSFLFCIFLLYRTDPQVEVLIRILLKEAAIVSKMWTPAITLWFPEHRFK